MDARVSMLEFGAAIRPDTQESVANQLIREHTKLSKRIAWQVFSRVSSAIAVEDLVQIGHIALIESAQNFVDQGNATFATYATVRVRGAMIDALRKSATMSRSSMRQRREFGRVRQNLQNSLGRPPSETEMADKVNLAVSAYRTAVSSMQSIEYSSIEDEYSDSSSWFADDAPRADEVLDIARRRDAIAAVIAKLPHREQTILQLYFVDECSLQEISEVFNVSAARICQIKRTALDNLKTKLAKWKD